MQVWLDGLFVEQESAQVSIFDAGFQHGVGLFETLAACNGRIVRPFSHMHRLAGSAKSLMLTEQLHIEPLVEAIQLTVAKNQLTQARVRLTLTGGNLNYLRSQDRRSADPTILIVAQPPQQYPDAFFDQGVVVSIADGRSNPLDPTAGHKTLNYWPRIAALQVAAARGAAEALWFSVSNHLAGGSVSNVFLYKDGGLLTPIARGEEAQGGLPAPVLPGITREIVIEVAEDAGIPVEKRQLDIEDLLSAEEVFLTNSSWGVLPVIAVEKEKIGEGGIGAVTHQLRQRWLALIEQETAASG